MLIVHFISLVDVIIWWKGVVFCCLAEIQSIDYEFHQHIKYKLKLRLSINKG